MSISSEIWNLCATEGNLETIKFLHNNNAGGCTPEVVDLAAKNNHLDIIKYLRENRSEGCTPYALNNAIQGGYTNIASYLLENFEVCFNLSEAVELAAEEGNLDIIDLLVVHTMKHLNLFN
ncbi:uncharacterized protein LOC135119379 [Zophobas morio]|uniref:uncharacterized protein LOC135119379 n=1 Tax=Zophobas morio TaxID=2755281 RepID=UPI003082A0AA